MSTENLAARLRLMSGGAIRLSSKALNKAADELDRLTAALAEHMQLTREAVEQCDKLRAQLREIESAPVPEPAADYETLLRQFRAAVAVMRAKDLIAARVNQRCAELESAAAALESEREANAILTARVAELEQQPVRWLPIEEAPKDKDVFLWSRHLGDAFSGSWHSKFGWVDSQYNKLPNVTHFAEIVGPDGER